MDGAESSTDEASVKVALEWMLVRLTSLSSAELLPVVLSDLTDELDERLLGTIDLVPAMSGDS